MNHHSSTDSSSSSVVGANSISRRAYELWEQEGRPEGSDLRHWLQAEQEMSASQSEGVMRHETATAAAPGNTGSDMRPLQGTRAAAAVNRESKRGSNAPFSREKNGQGSGNSQSAARRKPPQAPLL